MVRLTFNYFDISKRMTRGNGGSASHNFENVDLEFKTNKGFLGRTEKDD